MREEEKEQKLQVSVSQLAYKKIVYHLLRYPTSKVYGVLTGSLERTVANAYPLFHTPLVNPPFSLALDLIESNLPAGQQIIGFYEFVEGSECKINSLIENNTTLKNMIPMRVFMDGDKQIRTGAARYVFACPPFSSLQNGLRKGQYRFLVDMDAHLEEIELDFRNRYLD